MRLKPKTLLHTDFGLQPLKLEVKCGQLTMRK